MTKDDLLKFLEWQSKEVNDKYTSNNNKEFVEIYFRHLTKT